MKDSKRNFLVLFLGVVLGVSIAIGHGVWADRNAAPAESAIKVRRSTPCAGVNTNRTDNRHISCKWNQITCIL